MVAVASFAIASSGLAACSTSAPAAAPPTHEDVVDSYREQGLSEPVARCVAGWAERFDVEFNADGSPATDDDELVLSEATHSCGKASELVNDTSPEPEKLAFDDSPNSYGDDTELDRLWDGCQLGDGEACDELFQLAPVGSEYEEFGVTCGERLGLLDCAEELDLVAD